MSRVNLDDDLEYFDVRKKASVKASSADSEVKKDSDIKKKKKSKKSGMKKFLADSLYILAVLILAVLFVKYVGQRTTVIGSSMEPTLSDGDNLIVDKLTYRISDPKRFDVIVFPFQYEEGTYYIKRIIGLPGETVRIDENGNIYINGNILTENYGAAVITDPGLAINDVVVGEDEYFVLGDNRNHSSDSRTQAVGLIKREDILGRAWLRIFPFKKIGFVKHR